MAGLYCAIMKIFIWEDILCDYTCGMVVAYARTLGEAFALIEEEEGYMPSGLNGTPPTRTIDCEKDKEPFCVIVAGGG